MHKKIILTSVIAMCFIAPAMAEPSHSSNTFPNASLGEYMQEDYTYTNAATAANMDGVYADGATVDAIAEYDNILYQIAAGEYLPANSTTATPCPAGSFCGGVTDAVYNETTAQGITACPNGYTGSAEGASSNTDCYRACALGDVAHATAVTGAMYYNGTDGDGVNACAPAENSCENGYHYSPVVVAPDLSSIGNNAASGFGYISNDGEGTYNASTYGLSQNGTFVVDYGNGKKISGQSQCSTRSATNPWVGTDGAYVLQSDGTTSDLPNASGQYCWCQLEGYTLNGGAMQSLSAPWVFSGDRDDADDCAVNCAGRCAYDLQDGYSGNLAFRAAVFGSPQSTPASCAANTITINWGDVDPAYAGNNNEGTATYGGDIRTPFKAATKPGKTFSGWRFRAPTNP